ncbi:MAG: DUF4365 domain-containing protein [Deltaproteobacteria bacterium]|nr:DUF4365 domain-containing protein [Deltaproteobacteria bacterium]
MVRSILTQRRGFICRIEQPDYAVDLDVELIRNNTPSGSKFAIQIKSKTLCQRVSQGEDEFISFSFPIDTLEYLSRRVPGFGIVIIYETSSATAYYDFVEALVSRITEERDNDDWRNQNTVSIHIPTANVLNEDAAIGIWQVYDRRFSRFDEMFKKHSPDYGISLLYSSCSEKAKPQEIINNPVAFLQDYGFYLFNARDIELLSFLLEKTESGKLKTDPNLTLLSILTYTERGLLVDAEYYLAQARNVENSYSPEQRVFIDIYATRIAFQLGRTSTYHYRESLKKALSSPDINEHTRFGIEIKLLSLASIQGDVDHLEIGKQIDHLQEKIRKSELNERDRFLLLINTALVSHIVTLAVSREAITRMRITKKVKGETPIELRVELVRLLIKMFESSQNTLQEALKYGLKNDDRHLVAEVQNRISQCFLSFVTQSAAFINGNEVAERSLAPQNIFQRMVNQAVNAYNFFVEKGLLDDALSALTTAYEIQLVFVHHYCTEMKDPSKEVLLDHIRPLTKALGRDDYTPLVTGFFEQLSSIAKSSLYELSDQEAEKYAAYFVRATDLPDDRKQNVLKDIQNHKLFRSMIDDPNAELLQNLKHSESPATLYSETLIYLARCSVCGFRTIESVDVNNVAREWRLYHGFRCLK